jgi:hypothetical protein
VSAPDLKKLLGAAAALGAAALAAALLGRALVPQFLGPRAAIGLGGAVAQAAPYFTLAAAVAGAGAFVWLARAAAPGRAGLAVALAAAALLAAGAAANAKLFRKIDRQDRFHIRRVPPGQTLAAFISRSPDHYNGIEALQVFRSRAHGAVLHVDRASAGRAYLPAHRMAGVGTVRVDYDARPVTAAVDASWVRVSFVPFAPLYLDPAALRPHAELCAAPGAEASLIVTSCPPERP